MGVLGDRALGCVWNREGGVCFFVLEEHSRSQKIQKKGLTEGTAMRYNRGVKKGTKCAWDPQVVVKGKASMIYSKLYRKCYLPTNIAGLCPVPTPDGGVPQY